MMLFPRHAGRSPIGLDIGARAIAAVQLDSSGAIAAAALIPRRPAASGPAAPAAPSPFSSADVAALDDVLYRHAFTGRIATLTAPDDQLLADILELPPRSSGAPIEQLARMEIARAHKLNPDAVEIALWDIPAPIRSGGPGGAATHIMTAACAHASADALLAPFDQTGFRIAALDARVWALTRACAPILPPLSLCAILDLREESALLAFTSAGPPAIPIYQRVMAERGIARLRSRIRETLQVSAEIADHLLDAIVDPLNPAPASEPPHPAQRAADGPHAEIASLIAEHFAGLADEVRTALDYAAHRYPSEVSRVALCGPGAALPQVVEQFASRVGVQTQVAAPAALATVPAEFRTVCDNPALTAALGLAQWGIPIAQRQKGRAAA